MKQSLISSFDEFSYFAGQTTMNSENHRLNLISIMLCLVGIWSFGYLLYLHIGKYEVSYTINGFHTPLLDVIMKYSTHLGDGAFAIVLGLYWLFFINRREAVYLLLTYGLSSAITQGAKRLIFTDALRPVLLLDENRMHLVNGVVLNQQFSFPSGHATTIFAVAIGVSLLLNNARSSVIYISIAAWVAVSRVYLLQHFITDILVGACIGSFCAILLFYAFKPQQNEV